MQIRFSTQRKWRNFNYWWLVFVMTFFFISVGILGYHATRAAVFVAKEWSKKDENSFLDTTKMMKFQSLMTGFRYNILSHFSWYFRVLRYWESLHLSWKNEAKRMQIRFSTQRKWWNFNHWWLVSVMTFFLISVGILGYHATEGHCICRERMKQKECKFVFRHNENDEISITDDWFSLWHSFSFQLAFWGIMWRIIAVFVANEWSKKDKNSFLDTMKINHRWLVIVQFEKDILAHCSWCFWSIT